MAFARNNGLRTNFALVHHRKRSFLRHLRGRSDFALCTQIQQHLRQNYQRMHTTFSSRIAIWTLPCATEYCLSRCYNQWRVIRDDENCRKRVFIVTLVMLSASVRCCLTNEVKKMLGYFKNLTRQQIVNNIVNLVFNALKINKNNYISSANSFRERNHICVPKTSITNVFSLKTV